MLRHEDEKFVTPPGEPLRPRYQPKVCDDGHIEIYVVGYEDWQEKINSYRESSDIRTIVARYENTGDPTVLDQRQGMFGDFTNLPKTYAEALQLQINSGLLFDSLPLDVRKKFDMDKNRFFAMSGTDEWRKVLGDLLPEQMRYVEPAQEVKTE